LPFVVSLAIFGFAQQDESAPPRSDQSDSQPQSQSQQSPDEIRQSQPLPRSDNSQPTDSSVTPPEPSDARPGVPPPAAKPDRNPNESSSRSAIIDLSPPVGDKAHDEDEDTTGVREMTPWDPLKCEKDVEVGDYYFKQGNMRAAESRYREALYWKPGDAEATIRMARLYERIGNHSLAQQYFETYLKILPAGPHAKEAKAAIAKLQKES
jgi:tetratricopeptide (TPR) repeat protein